MKHTLFAIEEIVPTLPPNEKKRNALPCRQTRNIGKRQLRNQCVRLN